MEEGHLLLGDTGFSHILGRGGMGVMVAATDLQTESRGPRWSSAWSGWPPLTFPRLGFFLLPALVVVATVVGPVRVGLLSAWPRQPTAT